MATEPITSVKPRATASAPRETGAPRDEAGPREQSGPPLWQTVLKPLASLKLTVVLMALSIFIVLAGTFAQTRLDIWDAIRGYFRIDFARTFNTTAPFFHPSELFVWIDAKLFFPPSFFPADPVFPQGLSWLAAIWPTQAAIQAIPDSVGIWFPRGWTIGVLMVANLLAAHLVRFKLQASGVRLWCGLGLIALGSLVTYVIVATHGSGLQTQSWISYENLWRLLQFSMFALAAPCIYGSVMSTTERWGLRSLLGVAAALLCLGGAVSIWSGPAAPESMRILYQLIKGLLAALVLLSGCLLVFRRRAGIVLLHAGVGLLMAYEVLVGTQHVEMQMVLPQGESTNFAYDVRASELAVVDRSDPLHERHIVIDSSALQPGAVIQDDRLPFDLEVVEWIPNGIPERLKAGEKAIATRGLGKMQRLMPQEKSVGTDSKQDFPGMYVRVLRKESPAAGSSAQSAPAPSRDLGVYMLSTVTDPALRLMPFVETVELPAEGSSTSAAPHTYDLALRFVRHYKDYQLELVDFQKNDYAGTRNARDFRSIVNLYRPDGTKELDHYHIWMNNPLRFGGETFYQSEWRPDASVPTTVLQVVQNEGWMAPYVACMIVAVGMFYQFGSVMLRFMDRRQRTTTQAAIADVPTPEIDESFDHTPRLLAAQPWLKWALPLGISSLVILSLGSYFARQRVVVREGYHLSEFANLPVVMGGRSLPLESVAMNALMQISDLQSFKERNPVPNESEKPKSLPASQWLLDMITRPEVADTYPVFRIENDMLARALGLEVTESRRYAYASFKDKLPELRQQMREVQAKKPRSSWTVDERKRIELLRKESQYLDVRSWFGDLEPTMRKDFPQLFRADNTPVQRATLVFDMVRRLDAFAEDSKEFRVPLVVPLNVGEAPQSITRFEKLRRTWESYPVATGFRALDRALGVQSPPALEKFQAMLDAWKARQPEQFNAAVVDYRELLASAPPADMKIANTQVDLARSAFEGFYNRAGAFNLLSFAYLLPLLLTLAGWMTAAMRSSDWAQLLQRTALWTSAALLVLHTLAIVGRIYISGRPPVTNLYSSAIFIGWAAVLMGLVFERVFRHGLGNAVAAISGFLTLRIAHALMSDGDTLAVVEAVLDTQFWLATHVVCITIGYAATYVAGLFGLMYVIRGFFPGDATSVAETQKTLARMTYGTICAATMLSFVGTVLGGLWADDSWGRFWGWDPKENGALIIVLWNTLILHARWDGLVRDRGLAALAILGNIVTSWSWFGVNELGIGLHSYGFTEGRLFWLLAFCISQGALFALACLPESIWQRDRRGAAA